MAIKVGSEDKKKVYLAAGLGGVMLILLIRFLWQTFGPSPTAPTAPPPVVTVTRPATTSGETSQENTAGQARRGARPRRLLPARHDRLGRPPHVARPALVLGDLRRVRGRRPGHLGHGIHASRKPVPRAEGGDARGSPAAPRA